MLLKVFKPAVCPASNPLNASAGLSKANLAPRRPLHGNSSAKHYRPNTREPGLSAFKPAVCLPTAMAFTMSKLVPASRPPAGPSKATIPLHTSGQTPGPCAFKGVQACRLPGLKPFKCFRRPFQSQSRPPQATPRQLFRNLYRPNTREPGLSRPWPSPCPSLFQQARPPQAHPRQLFRHTPAAKHQGHVLLKVFKPAVCPASNPLNGRRPFQSQSRPPQAHPRQLFR